MQLRSVGMTLAVAILAVGTSRADFKYTQQTKMTGGALAGMTKTLGVFSKNARQMNEPQTTTHMLKGNRLRMEHPDGLVQIIDLDGKRFIHIDPSKKTYTIVTFEQFRQQMEQAREKLKEEQAKAAAKNPQAQNVKMVPHFDAQTTGATKTILGLTASEMKVKLEMQFQSDDPATQAKMQNGAGSMWVTSDEWVAPSVPGYDQMRVFYEKMAKELDWLPGEMGSMMGGSNAQMGSAMEEFRKHSTTVKGMPLLMYTSMGMGAEPAQAQTAGAQGQTPSQQPPPQQASQQPPPQTQSDNSTPTNPKDAIVKGLGGMFGHKKQQQQQQQQPQQQQQADNSSQAGASGSGTPPAPAGPSNSMMDTTTEVTSYSSDSLDASLFDVPAGYTQVQPDPNHPVGW